MADVQDDLSDAWLTATLRADSTLVGLIGQNIFNAEAPDTLLTGGSLDVDGKATAFVVFNFVSGDDEHVALTRVDSRVQVANRYLVKVVSLGRDRLRYRPVLRCLDALHGAEGDYDGFHFVCQRASPVRYLEPLDGHHWWHAGGYHDLTIHPI